MDDKVFALSILKKSGQAYKYLRRIFALPSRKTLQNLLNRIPFQCGINDAVFLQMKYAVNKMKPLDLNCILMFDEVQLSPGLEYDQKNDTIKGFVDFGGEEKQPIFADHALVFMIKGVHAKWKQPVCYCFTAGMVSTADLLRMIKKVVYHVHSTGLNIVASVCDQGATNVAAINTLLRDTRAHYLRENAEDRNCGYVIDGKEVIHIYDCPHLMKGVRNALLTKNLSFIEDGKQKIASRSHIIEMYNLDQKLGPYSQFIHLTDQHVLPDRLRKMSVKHCTQVFSHRVATAMKARALISEELSPQSKYYISPSASQTMH